MKQVEATTGLRAVAEALDEISRIVIRQAALRELSLSALSTLGALDASGPSRLTDLAVRENVSQPSMTAMVARLAGHGLVERRDDPRDGRIVLVAITERGRHVLVRRRAARVAFLAGLVARLDPTDQQVLAEAAPALHRLTDPEAVSATLVALEDAAGHEEGGE